MPDLPGNDPHLLTILVFAIGFGLAIIINIYGLWRLTSKEMRYRPGDLSPQHRSQRDIIDYPAGPGLTGRNIDSSSVADRHGNDK